MTVDEILKKYKWASKACKKCNIKIIEIMRYQKSTFTF